MNGERHTTNVYDIPGKSSLAGIALWEYHEIPICIPFEKKIVLETCKS